MKIAKKMAALAAMAAILLNAAAVPVNAESGNYWTFTYTEVENGAAVVHNDKDVWGFIVVTDGTELEPFDYNGNLNQPLRSVKKITTDRETFIATWDEGMAALLESYGPYAKFYSATLLPQNFSRTISEISRSYMLEHEAVLDVILYTIHIDAKAEWSGGLEVYFERETPFEALQEYEDAYEAIFQECQEQYNEWQLMLSDWRRWTNTSGMTGAEIAASRAAAGIPTDYEMLDYAYGKGEQIRALYQGYVTFVQPELSLISGTVLCTGASAWDGIGDADENGTVDAGDAAAILTEAALIGAGGIGTFSEEQNTAADVNADGQVNSADAAYILAYCSQSGTDTGVTMADVVKR